MRSFVYFPHISRGLELIKTPARPRDDWLVSSEAKKTKQIIESSRLKSAPGTNLFSRRRTRPPPLSRSCRGGGAARHLPGGGIHCTSWTGGRGQNMEISLDATALPCSVTVSTPKISPQMKTWGSDKLLMFYWKASKKSRATTVFFFSLPWYNKASRRFSMENAKYTLLIKNVQICTTVAALNQINLARCMKC